MLSESKITEQGYIKYLPGEHSERFAFMDGATWASEQYEGVVKALDEYLKNGGCDYNGAPVEMYHNLYKELDKLKHP